MFGKRQVRPTGDSAIAGAYFKEPRVALSGAEASMDRATDQTVAALSQQLGIDLDFDVAYIFSPRLWEPAEIGAMLTKAGIQPEMTGNKMTLLKSPATVLYLSKLPRDHPLRASLEKSGFGMVLYDPSAENGFSDGLAEMQRTTLAQFASKHATDEARKYAVFDLHRFSSEVMKGR